VVDAVDHVGFTGSTATGRIVAQQAAARLVGASLELGGKNSLYVAADADLDRAAEAAVRDCFTSAGQLCLSMERLLLHERIADPFLDRFVDRVRRLRMGPAMDFSTDLGCLASAAQLRRVTSHVEDAVAHGAGCWPAGGPGPTSAPCSTSPPCWTGCR
jgi:succinate-semialdehyde dehydrogenase/glutarate-semialdehyde dehydrogenase